MDRRMDLENGDATTRPVPTQPPLTAPALRALTHVHLRLPTEVRRLRPAAVPPSWLICQPLQTVLQKPLYPLIAMAAAQANGGGSIGDRHAVRQEEQQPATAGQASRDGGRPLPRQECQTLRRRQVDRERGFAPLHHTVASQQRTRRELWCSDTPSDSNARESIGVLYFPECHGIVLE